MWKLTALGMVGALACTSRNPRACDTDLPCPDPAMPFCDLDGVVSGTPYSCVAVDCTPGAFVACNEDRAVQCNAAGDNYDTVVCERGCDPASDGCRLCNPDETACTNGVVATCDAAGAVVAQEACPLGCFEAEPRCRDIDPSNGLGAALDQADTAPVLDLSAGGSIDTTTGQVFGVGGPILIPSVLLPAPADGVAILVLIVKSAILGQVSVVTSGLNPDRLRWRHRGA